jgi:hypothetical protein
MVEADVEFEGPPEVTGRQDIDIGIAWPDDLEEAAAIAWLRSLVSSVASHSEREVTTTVPSSATCQ